MRNELTKTQQLVQYELVDSIAILTLSYPEKRNVLSTEVLSALKAHLESIKEDRAVRVVIVRAMGSVFSSGHDLRELLAGDDEDNACLFSLCTEVMEAIRLLPQPVIAQVQGLATAAGCQLVASCDMAVASHDATFATPGVKNGLFCTTPGVALVRAVQPKKAMEMLLTGMPISAQDALMHGLVSRVVPAEKLEEQTMVLARQVAVASSYTVAIGKRAFYQQLEMDRAAAYELAQKVMVENLRAHDAREGIDAFLSKRKPKWTDR